MSRIGSPRRIGVVLLVALVLLAGCGGAGSGGAGGGAGSADVEETAVAEAGAPETRDGGSGDDALQVRQRQVIRTGQVTLRVDDFGRARRNLTAAAQDLNGFVSDSSRRRHEVTGGTYVTGSVTLRVPRERFGAMMDRAEAAGTVQSSTVQSKDVTDQLVDIEARLENLRAQRERLRTLYERANDTEAILEVQQRLSETQERIERLEAQKRSLERRVAYSTVRVELREERPEPGPEEIEQWYDVPLVGAFLESVNGVVVVVRAAAVLAAYALPYLLAFGLPPALLVAVGYRRWRASDGDGAGADPTDGGGNVPDSTGGENGSGEESATGEDESATGDDESATGDGVSADSDGSSDGSSGGEGASGR